MKWPCSILGCESSAYKFIFDGAETLALCGPHLENAVKCDHVKLQHDIKRSDSPRKEYWRMYHKTHQMKKKKYMKDYYIRVIKPRKEARRNAEALQRVRDNEGNSSNKVD